MRGVVTIVSLVVSCAYAGVVRAGDLTPPPGPVSPTMKTLEAIEPRVCVQELPGAANATHVISEDGAYYLVADIVGEAGKHGILITADRVSLDLGPFSIAGVPGSLDGVHMAPASGQGAFVMTGLRAEVTSVTGFDGDGVRLLDALSVSISGVTVSNTGGDGVAIDIGEPDPGWFAPQISLEGLSAKATGQSGVRVSGPLGSIGGAAAKLLIKRGSARQATLNGFHIERIGSVRLEDVDATENTGHGLFFSLDGLRCAAQGFLSFEGGKSLFNGGHGVVAIAGTCDDGLPAFSKSFARGVTACGNGLDGFRSDGMIASEWEDCESAKNGGYGFSIFRPAPGEWWYLSMTDTNATENALDGCYVEAQSIGGASRLSLRGVEMSRNGPAAVPKAHGLHIATFGVDPGPGDPSAIELDITDSSFLSNSGDGVRVRSVHKSSFTDLNRVRASANGGSGVDLGPGDGAAFFDIAVNFDDIFCSANGVDGLAVFGATGGTVTNCTPVRNGGTGILLATGPVSSYGVQIDKCVTTANDIGIVVEGEHFLTRCAAMHNTSANMSLNASVFAGPSVVSPAWTENKPYSWP